MNGTTIGKLLKFVQNVNQPWWRYVPYTFLIAFIPSMLISVALGLIVPMSSSVNFGKLTIGLILSLVLLAPLLETLIMWPVISGIQRIGVKRPIVVAAISALVWAVFHSLQTPVWGLTVGWSFFIFSLCFVSWKTVSNMKAYLMTFSIHAMQNSLAVGYLLLRGG